MVRRVIVLCLGAALAAGLAILGYVGVDTLYPSPNCSLENCNLPIFLIVVIPGVAATVMMILLRIAGVRVTRLMVWILGLAVSIAAVVFAFPRGLREPTADPDEAFLGGLFLLFVLAPGATAALLAIASAVYRQRDHRLPANGASEREKEFPQRDSSG